MIYVLGDSYSYGWNFYKQQNPKRKELIFSQHLSQMFNTECKNLSMAGSSNYRIARLLLDIDLGPDDIVVIGWTELSRIEIGFPKDRIVPKDVIVQHENIENLEDKKLEFVQAYQIIEKTGNLYTRNVWGGLENSLNDISNHSFREFIVSFYRNAGEIQWFEQMFKMLFYACLYKLRASNCKFAMFTTFESKINDRSFLNIPEYIFHDSDMSSKIRIDNKTKYTKDTYWSEIEHRKVAEIIYNQIIRGGK